MKKLNKNSGKLVIKKAVNITKDGFGKVKDLVEDDESDDTKPASKIEHTPEIINKMCDNNTKEVVDYGSFGAKAISKEKTNKEIKKYEIDLRGKGKLLFNLDEFRKKNIGLADFYYYKDVENIIKEKNNLEKDMEAIQEGRTAFQKAIEERGYNKAREEFNNKLEQLKQDIFYNKGNFSHFEFERLLKKIEELRNETQHKKGI